MGRVKVTDNFYLDEFVPPEIYNVRGARSLALMDIRIILACQHIRDISGRRVTVNNWWNGGALDERGLRISNTPTGARWSQHKYGRAVDLSVDGMRPREVHDLIRKHEIYFIERQWITTLENPAFTPTWTHIDCRHTGLDRFLIVDP